MTAYHVSRNDKTLGVYPEADARDYYAQGRIGPGDLVWREGMPAWLTAAHVFGPPPQAAAAPMAPPAPPPVAAASPSTSPLPATATPPSPRLHWALLLLLTVVTLGIFYVVWLFIQGAWVRKIHARSNAITLLVVYLVLVLGGEIVSAGAAKDSTEAAAGGMLVLAGSIAAIVAIFSMRRSMLDYFNQAGSIGLKLSWLLTLLFGAFYLQYHLTRIARWKATGLLPVP